MDPHTDEEFSPPLRQFTDLEVRQWGKPSNYSAQGVFGFCNKVLNNMPKVLKGRYDRNYWTEVAFVTDGNCGSACSMFTQALQLSGAATAFTFGSLANQAMDVASFGGGNVVQYSQISPLLNIASHLGYWATFGESEWSHKHKDSWVNKPIPFPHSAKVGYTWNIELAPQLGPDALPRQFYKVPAHKHLNMWARNLEERADVYSEIVGYKSWTDIRANPQFKDLGYCPAYADRATPSSAPHGAVGLSVVGTILVLLIHIVSNF